MWKLRKWYKIDNSEIKESGTRQTILDDDREHGLVAT